MARVMRHTPASTWVMLFKYHTFPSKGSAMDLLFPRPYRTASKSMPVMANTIAEYSGVEGTPKDDTVCKSLSSNKLLGRGYSSEGK